MVIRQVLSLSANYNYMPVTMSKWNVIRNDNLKRLLVLLFFCVLMPSVWAQEFSFSGRVTDASNRPISGASVQVKGKNASTLTDEDGTFSLSLNVGDILQVSYVGYTPEELTITNQNPVTILLMEANNDLDE